jgi:predicted secreted Zn-dependent protease
MDALTADGEANESHLQVAHGGAARASGTPGEAARSKTGPAPASDAVTIQSATNYYTIAGNTAAELAAQINTLGPTDGDHRYAANTAWRIAWSYRYAQGEGGCAIAAARVDVRLTFTYPQWTPPPGTPQELIERWERFMGAVRYHEQGHSDLAITAGAEVQRVVQATPVASTCALLDEAANAAAQQVLAEFDQQQRHYDEHTNHGETQGALF